MIYIDTYRYIDTYIYRSIYKSSKELHLRKFPFSKSSKELHLRKFPLSNVTTSISNINTPIASAVTPWLYEHGNDSLSIQRKICHILALWLKRGVLLLGDMLYICIYIYI